MKIILAIDSFKGCLTSEEVENNFLPSLVIPRHDSPLITHVRRRRRHA